MFGHVKGAFTGATTDRAGAAELANGGTLFLDEIGEMPIDLQPKLLRFLQTGSYSRVGDGRPRQTDIRIIAATNRDPWASVRAGLLREDLYFRLNVIPVELPALRERGSDILLLAESFIERFCREEQRKTLTLTSDAEAALLAYGWPGNVRELENMMRRAVVLAQGASIDAGALNFQNQATSAVTPMAPGGPLAAETVPLAASAAPMIDVRVEPLWQTEKRAIEHAIALCRDNVSEAAKQLGIAPSTIYRKRESWVEQEKALSEHPAG